MPNIPVIYMRKNFRFGLRHRGKFVKVLLRAFADYGELLEITISHLLKTLHPLRKLFSR